MHEQKESQFEEWHIFQTCTLYICQQHWWTHCHNSGTINYKFVGKRWSWICRTISDCGQASDNYIHSVEQSIKIWPNSKKKRWHRACETTTVVVHKGSVGKASAISKFLLSWIEAKRICYGFERYWEQNHVLELPLDLITLAVLDPSIPK